MIKNLKWGAVGLLILVGLYVTYRYSQAGHATSAQQIFRADQSAIAEIAIKKGDDEIELYKESEQWRIAGNDSLVIRQNRMDNFFEKVLAARHETLMSQNEEKWGKYSVDDSTGTHVILRDADGKTVDHVVFGRSRSDWSHNYVRIVGSPNVYLTSENIIYHLNPQETFWGEKPKPPEPPADTTATPDEQLESKDQAVE